MPKTLLISRDRKIKEEREKRYWEKKRDLIICRVNIWELATRARSMALYAARKNVLRVLSEKRERKTVRTGGCQQMEKKSVLGRG